MSTHTNQKIILQVIKPDIANKCLIPPFSFSHSPFFHYLNLPSIPLSFIPSFNPQWFMGYLIKLHVEGETLKQTQTSSQIQLVIICTLHVCVRCTRTL